MIKTVKNKTTILLRLVFVLVIFVFSAKKAHAGWLDDAASSAIGSAVLYINNLIMYLLGNLLATVAEWLGWFLKYQGDYFENISIVRESWAVFRDFSNMFFILILIVIAFATIFDMQQYNWKGLMAKFIIAALLINFSLAIGGFIIKISTTLSNVAINQFTDITGNLAAGAGINKYITAGAVAGSSADSLLKLTLSTFISGVGMIIMTAILLLAFLSALAFSIARVPVLWALLIVSPIAWITYILPQTRRIWSDWWKHFLCWTFFMPAYLFSLVMGIAILSNRPDIGAAATTTNFVGFGVQGIFFYVLTIIILVGSLGASLKMACAAGTGVAKTMGTISGTVNKWAADRSGYTAAKKGLTEKAGEIKDTGLKGRIGGFLYGGERANRLREAKVAEYLGKKGALSEAEAGEVQKSYALRKSQNLGKDDLEKLNVSKLNKFETLAIRKLRAENGWVASGPAGEQEIKDTISQAGAYSQFAQEYISALEKNGFAEALGSRDQAEKFAHNLGAEFLPLKKVAMKQMAKNNEVLNKEFAKEILDVFSTESHEAKEAVEKDLQKNIKNFSETRSKKERQAALTDPSKLPEKLRKLLAQQMSEDGEITTYQKYKIAAELFGGENEAKSREMLGKIAKDKPLAHADYLFRKKLRDTDSQTEPADYDPFGDPNITPQEKEQRENAFKKEVQEKLPKMTAKALAESDLDILNLAEFKTAFWDYIAEKEKAEPTEIGNGGRMKEGGGKRILRRLQKALEDSPDQEKQKIVDLMLGSLEANYPPKPKTPKIPGRGQGGTPPSTPSQPKRTPGFVPPGSTVTSQGQVKNP